jgi:beta-phosphoglucomutase-like phosphatase (HAD superfamily)
VTLEATLFDMDGLLFDTEVLWHKAEAEVFGALGVPLDEAKDRSTKGMYVDEVVEYWHSRFPWSGPTQNEVVAKLLARVGELRALDLASQRGPIALASSTPLVLIHRCLEHFELRDRFVSVHSAEFEPFGKPHPGVFLTAAASLNVAPQRCLVFEDSAAGVLAAKAGTMTVVAVPTPDDRAQPAFGLADLVLDSLEQLSSDWLDVQFA